eukprot:5191929-Prorocentrum_lima.AAC.1
MEFLPDCCITDQVCSKQSDPDMDTSQEVHTALPTTFAAMKRLFLRICSDMNLNVVTIQDAFNRLVVDCDRSEQQ